MNRTCRMLFCLPFALTACNSSIKDTLGLGKEAPDEFVVVSRPPLSVPPDFQLRPPSSDTAPANPTPEENAREALLGSNQPATPVAGQKINGIAASAPISNATSLFLNKAGASNASSDIRDQLNEDAKNSPARNDAGSFYEKVMGSKKSDTVVDPQKETERIRDNKAEGKPLTEGDTPNAPPASKSVLDNIF